MASKAAFNHIVRSVLGQKDGSPLCKALEWAGIDNVAGTITLLLRHIEGLKFNDGTDGEVLVTDLPFGLKQLILCFKAFIKMKLDGGTSVHEDWQNLVTGPDFASFRLIGHGPDYLMQDANVKPAIVTSSGQASDNAPFRPNRPCVLSLNSRKGQSVVTPLPLLH